MLRGGGDSRIIQDVKAPKNRFSKMYHNYSRSQGLPNLIFQDVPRLQNMIFLNVLIFQVSYNIIPNHPNSIHFFFKDMSDLLGFTSIPRSSNMFQDLEDFIKIPPCWFPVFLTVVNANCFWTQHHLF